MSLVILERFALFQHIPRFVHHNVEVIHLSIPSIRSSFLNSIKVVVANGQSVQAKRPFPQQPPPAPPEGTPKDSHTSWEM